MKRPISTKTREKAAQLVAAGRLTLDEIASKCGVSQRSISRWIKNESFVARVEKLTEEYSERALRRGLAVKANRILELTRRYNELDEMVEARKTRNQFFFIPDYQHGHIAITEITRLKGNRVGAIPSTEAVEDTGQAPADPWSIAMSGGQYRVKCALDHQTIGAMTSILDQIAVESGDRVHRSEINLPSRLADLSDEQVVALAQRLGVDVPEELRR